MRTPAVSLAARMRHLGLPLPMKNQHIVGGIGTGATGFQLAHDGRAIQASDKVLEELMRKQHNVGGLLGTGATGYQLAHAILAIVKVPEQLQRMLKREIHVHRCRRLQGPAPLARVVAALDLRSVHPVQALVGQIEEQPIGMRQPFAVQHRTIRAVHVAAPNRRRRPRAKEEPPLCRIERHRLQSRRDRLDDDLAVLHALRAHHDQVGAPTQKVPIARRPVESELHETIATQQIRSRQRPAPSIGRLFVRIERVQFDALERRDVVAGAVAD